MQTRYRAAATALLLTATAGMAATGGPAEASGTHHHDAKAKSLTITIKSKDGKIKLSDDSFRPGNTVFRVKNAAGKHARGGLQVFRLRGSYTIGQAASDFALAFSGNNDPATIDAINRIDDNVVFYGGMNAPRKKGGAATKWAVNIDKDSLYYVLNTKSNALTTFTAQGSRQKRTLPSRTGFINPETSHNAAGNKFVAGKHNQASGWMSTRNKAEEPHFVDIQQVKKGTTNSDLSALFTGGGGNPFVKHGAKTGTGVISPGHRFLWAYHLKQGKYGVFCFWPSKTDGMPHAVMGMHIVTRLH
jgi:hypothetical protein